MCRVEREVVMHACPTRLIALALALAAGSVSAQSSPGLSLGAGLRLWQMDWTTFSYAPSGGSRVLTQELARSELVSIPILNARYGDWVASVSAYGKTDFVFESGERGSREEIDINVGWYVMPTLALTLGYKRVVQSGREGSYEPRGLVFGLSAAAPLGGGFSFYGNFGTGSFRTPSGNPIKFDAIYRLTELGLVYAWGPVPWLQSLSFTAGWRMQTLRSKDALPERNQDGRDITEGLTLGVLARF
jgi:hypothetical protein